jgi:hypothetical protein
MPRLGLVLATLIALPVWLTNGPSVLACSGQDVTLANGTRQAASIYFARVVSDRASGDGFHTMTLDVGTVVKGTAPRHVSRVIGAKVCSGVPDGPSGLVILGSVNPLGGEPNGTYNLFYVFGPGYYSRAEAAALLLDAPATDSVDATKSPDVAEGGMLPTLGIAVGSMWGLLRWRHRRPLRARRPA